MGRFDLAPRNTMQIIRTHSTSTPGLSVVLRDHGDDATPRFSVTICNEGEITEEQFHTAFNDALGDYHSRTREYE